MQIREIDEDITYPQEPSLTLVRNEPTHVPEAQAPLPVVGYREWRLDTDEHGAPILRSVTTGTGWPHTEPLQAICRREHTWAWKGDAHVHRVPDAACECGVHASSHPFFERKPGDDDDRVVGVVVGLGRHEVDLEGWRAQRARVWALVDPEGRPEVARAAARYGARVLDAMPKAFDVTRALARER